MEINTLVTLTFFAFGLIMIALELLIPGFGLMGIGGFLFIILGINSAVGRLIISINSLLIFISVMVVVIFLVVKRAFKSKRIKSIVLQTSIDKDYSDTSIENKSNLIGKRGVTTGTLRPTGYAIIENEKVDVLSEAGLIEAGAEVEVVEVRENKIYVRRV